MHLSAFDVFFFFSSRRRHTRFKCDWSSDVCSSDLVDRHPTLDGFTVQVVSLDDAAAGVDDPAQGEHNMTALAGDPLVPGAIGPFDSTVARKVTPVASSTHLASFSPAAGSPGRTTETSLPAASTP